MISINYKISIWPKRKWLSYLFHLLCHQNTGVGVRAVENALPLICVVTTSGTFLSFLVSAFSQQMEGLGCNGTHIFFSEEVLTYAHDLDAIVNRHQLLLGKYPALDTMFSSPTWYSASGTSTPNVCRSSLVVQMCTDGYLWDNWEHWVWLMAASLRGHHCWTQPTVAQWEWWDEPLLKFTRPQTWERNTITLNMLSNLIHIFLK